MKITSTFNENGNKTLQEIMEYFLIQFFNDNLEENKD